MTYIILALQILILVGLVFFYKKSEAHFRRVGFEIQPEKIAAALVGEAIWVFQTDAIDQESLDPYIRSKYLDLCGTTGLDPSYVDVIQKEARKLIHLREPVVELGNIATIRI